MNEIMRCNWIRLPARSHLQACRQDCVSLRNCLLPLDNQSIAVLQAVLHLSVTLSCGTREAACRSAACLKMSIARLGTPFELSTCIAKCDKRYSRAEARQPFVKWLSPPFRPRIADRYRRLQAMIHLFVLYIRINDYSYMHILNVSP